MRDSDVTQLSLSERTHAMLQRLRDEGVFEEMRDAYRFGIALAVARGEVAPEDARLSRTVFGVSTIDSDGSLRDLLIELFPQEAERPYALAQRLAEAGVADIGRLHENNVLKFGNLFRASGVLGTPSRVGAESGPAGTGSSEDGSA
jgi:hypothetical protein